jgi:hypothetical protein
MGAAWGELLATSMQRASFACASEVIWEHIDKTKLSRHGSVRLCGWRMLLYFAVGC